MMEVLFKSNQTLKRVSYKKIFSPTFFSLLWDFKLVERGRNFHLAFFFLSFNIIYIYMYIFRLGRWINYDESHNYYMASICKDTFLSQNYLVGILCQIFLRDL